MRSADNAIEAMQDKQERDRILAMIYKRYPKISSVAFFVNLLLPLFVGIVYSAIFL